MNVLQDLRFFMLLILCFLFSPKTAYKNTFL